MTLTIGLFAVLFLFSVPVLILAYWVREHQRGRVAALEEVLADAVCDYSGDHRSWVHRAVELLAEGRSA